MEIVRLLTIIAIVASGICAQAAATQDDEDLQSWNDLQLTVPLGKKIDFFTKFTVRIGNNISRFNDGRHAVGIVWKPIAALSISPFYWHVKARNRSGSFRTENRLNLSATYRFPVKKVGLYHRSTYEHRMRSPVNTWRYRAMLTVEKEIPKSLVSGAKFFVADEIFYDSATDRFSRNRFSVGISKIISKHVGVDLYFTRQNDGFSHPGDLNIVWTAWKFRL